MTLKELYAVYGELHIQVEIMQGKMMEIKQKIAKGLNDGRSVPGTPQVDSGPGKDTDGDTVSKKGHKRTTQDV